MGEPLTVDEKMILKTAAFGAVFLISNADPGVLPMIKESFAASGVFVEAVGLVKDVIITGDLPQLPQGAAEVERIVLSGLQRSLEILQEKAPQEVENFRTTVISALEQVARASEGVSESEDAMMSKIREALRANPNG
ncbi:MAG TPA: hypothetical protein VFX60_04645 [Micromonospora sp.]|nr:hypothetical protein [Micromonospora sp.]